MSVNQFLNGKLNLIAGAGGGGSVIADDNTFTGTTAEVEAAIADGLIENDTIVFITDDVIEGGNGEAITIEVLDTYDEIMTNTELGKITGAAGVKEGFEQIQEELSQINISTLDTYDEIMNNTEANKPTGALGIKEGFEQVNEDLNDIKTSFQDGCNTIVAGCTTYGSTPTSNSPTDIVNSIKSIHTDRYNTGVTDTKKGTAVAADVLTGKTFTNSSGVELNGTMANKGALNWNPTSSTSYTVPAGYYSGGTLNSSGAYNAGVTATKKGTATAAQVLTGYTFTNSSSVGTSGSMTNRGAWNNTPTSSGKVTIPAGYHNGSGYVDTSKVYNAGVSASGVKLLDYYTNFNVCNVNVTRDFTLPTIGTYYMICTNVAGINSYGDPHYRVANLGFACSVASGNATMTNVGGEVYKIVTSTNNTVIRFNQSACSWCQGDRFHISIAVFG